MPGTLLFLADTHLHPERPDRAQSFFSFLRSHQGQAQAIHILGDLFDFWVGAKQARHPAWQPLLHRLGQVVRDGPPVGVLGGNRDYLLDEASLAPYGLKSLGRRHDLCCDGLAFTLVHGDRYYPDSALSRAFLWGIQNSLTCWLTRRVPLGLSLAVASAMKRWRQGVSENLDVARAPRYEPQRFRPLYEAGARVVVCGHNHWARDYSPELGLPGRLLLAVGDWANGPSYLEYRDGLFRLHDGRFEGGAVEIPVEPGPEP